MDASALLQSQGWRGHGHSLDHYDRGIKRPLLVSQKVDVLGVGLNKHKAVSDQWWLRAFDAGLKTLGTGQESALSQVQKHGVNRGGLYARFVRGEGVPGSIGQSPVEGLSISDRNSGESKSQSESESEEMAGKKRKRGDGGGGKKAKKQKTDGGREKQPKAKRNGTANDPREKEIDRRADEIVLEAQQRCIIPSAVSGQPAVRAQWQSDQLSEDIVNILTQAGLDPRKPQASASEQSGKKARYTREKIKRDVKRVAKAYLRGDGEDGGHKIAPVRKDAERLTNKEERAERKKAKRLEQKVRKPAADADVGEHKAPADDGQPAPTPSEPERVRKTLKPEKLAQYEERARLKGVTLEEYIKRRDEKYAAKQKLASKAHDEPAAAQPATGSSAPQSAKGGNNGDQPAFVIDTIGAPAGPSIPGTSTSSTGHTPLDPALWAGIPPKELPKHLRKARQQWMKARREARKNKGKVGRRAGDMVKGEERKSRKQRKADAREGFVKVILRRSREAAEGGVSEGGKVATNVTVDGVVVSSVPLVKVESKRPEAGEGERVGAGYTKEEMKAARRVARRVLRERKREEKGKSKGDRGRGKFAKKGGGGESGGVAELEPLGKKKKGTGGKGNKQRERRERMRAGQERARERERLGQGSGANAVSVGAGGP